MPDRSPLQAAHRSLAVSRDVLLAHRLSRGRGSRPTLLASYPKSGRTWLRFLLAHYFALTSGSGAAIDLHSVFGFVPNLGVDPVRGLPAFRSSLPASIPLVGCSHSQHRWQFRTMRTVFLGRTALDLLVSAYFNDSRQRDRFDGELDAYVRHPDLGVSRFTRYMRSWEPHLGRDDTFVVTYERLRADTASTVGELLAFLVPDVDVDVIRGAIDASRFDAMQKVELERGIAGFSYDAGDPDARRVRRGVVGGYREYLDDASIAHVMDVCRRELRGRALELSGAS